VCSGARLGPPENQHRRARGLRPAVDGIVRVTDRPPDGAGRAFLVERGLTGKAELDAMVADYVSESQRRDEPAVIVRVGDELLSRYPSE